MNFRGMKNYKLLILLTLLSVIISCSPQPDSGELLNSIRSNIESGNLKYAIQLADSTKESFPEDLLIYRQADSLSQIAERIGLDFSVSEEQVNRQIEKYTGSFSPEEKNLWENKGWLEYKNINGGKKYFSRAATNLLLIRNFYEQKEKRQQDIWNDPHMISRLKHAEEVYKASVNGSDPVVPVKMKITYTITVNPDVVPEGETIRCWLPWPKENHPRQQKAELISTSDSVFTIAPDSAIHRTIYMEETSKKGVPTVFQISFKYQSKAQYFDMSGIKILPYDKTSDSFKKYTSEQLPQICFTENIKRLADSITAPGDNPSEIVRKGYLWFKENIPWTGALEYSIIPNIPEYVLQHKRGDCGMQTFTLMSMLRYKGVPVRWQSGWMVPPESENLHDWCEVYYEGPGWVPVDVSYDLLHSEIRGIKEFYLSGIDAYRLIVNDGIAGDLYPNKYFLRSEPFDFQRGEVEWSGGNLYFDKWDYNMKIEYVK